MNKNDFRETFIKPLERAFEIKTYWNGQDSETVGLKITSGSTRGMCYTFRDGSIQIIIKYRKNEVEMLSTLIHEYAHAMLHDYDCRLEKSIKEIEAETVALNVLKKLKYEYVKAERYIKIYQNKYQSIHGREYTLGNRKNIIELVATMIYDVLKKIKKCDLKNDNDYKYKVVCDSCGTETYYKKETNIIKCNCKDYRCGICKKSTLKIVKL